MKTKRGVVVQTGPKFALVEEYPEIVNGKMAECAAPETAKRFVSIKRNTHEQIELDPQQRHSVRFTGVAVTKQPVMGLKVILLVEGDDSRSAEAWATEDELMELRLKVLQSTPIRSRYQRKKYEPAPTPDRREENLVAA